ncbi:MAG: hypothetical protein ABJP48_02625 [Erythrobacter sp.]
MREALNQWDFVIAAYSVSAITIVMLIVWAWFAMRTAERKRDEVKRR